MKPSLLFRIHMWFIRLVTRQVELVQNQLEINKLLNRIEKATYDMMSLPKITVNKKRRKK